MIGILAHSMTGFLAGLLFLGVLNVPLWVPCLPSIMFMALLLAWKGLVECVYMLGAVLFAWIIVFLLTMGSAPEQTPATQNQKTLVHYTL